MKIKSFIEIDARKSLTLVELLVAIAVASILVGGIALVLRAGLDTYSVANEEIFLQKVLDKALDDIASGGFESYGVKDALKILEATPASITFVPLWVDDSHRVIEPKRPLVLNRPFEPGASFPIVEVSLPGKRGYDPVPVTFILGSHEGLMKPDDKVIVNKPIPGGSKVRVVYQPDPRYFPDVAMIIQWDISTNSIKKRYKNQSTSVSFGDTPRVTLEEIRFQYFDNTNTEILPDRRIDAIPEELLAGITAIKVTATASTPEKSKKQSTFINLRTSRTAGVGMIIREGTRVRIPNSKDIRAFTLANIVGVKEGGHIDLEVRPKQGKIWKLHIGFEVKDGKSFIKEYSIGYPPGITMYTETINLATDLPLDFLILGGNNGLYDYDLDADVDDVVNLKGDTELMVTTMENIAGAALFIRP